MSEKRNYWFPAKRYGWGWGMPCAWQGWVAFALFWVLLLIGAVKILPAHGPQAFVVYSLGLTVLLVLVCWVKGEPPGSGRWE